ncbi:DUF4136 domain-containing protein [Glaciimonas sp. PCH181]|uniref:DUF4136 domain-containing protein n=1 Tax=Glaciimonas sp. PCH181 TaxID=2133943 RepID=UPI000D33CB30|nr:DUF4136 domain-containing protein [Glaciimonas sp. PCH181]PUA20260.1 DUF4136 domain-containing protein [Glaciimonas sp. PCH181]
MDRYPNRYLSHFLTLCLAAMCLLVAGCASVIRSDVTTFNEWPADLPDKSFVFAHTPEQNNDLEYRHYENLVRTALQQLGFTIAANGAQPQLKVSLAYGVTSRDVHVVEPVVIDTGFYGSPFYGPGWGNRGFYGPYSDPFWYNSPVVAERESNFQLFTRQLNVRIARASNAQKLYDVTVISEGKINSLAKVMPYLIQSAFTDFPGQSGVPRRVELKIKE